jgi:uracil phosphoribosyltransferase
MSERKLTVMKHPLIKHKIAKMSDAETGVKEFRELAGEVAMLIGFVATRDLPLTKAQVKTPVAVGEFEVLEENCKVALIPILRAGIGITEPLLTLIPTAKVGHVGIFRNPETMKPVNYYSKFPPEVADMEVYVLEIMLATGGTAIMAVDLLKKEGCKKIKFLCLVAAPEGIKSLHDAHPDVEIITGVEGECLNDHGYIMPGLGDAGDRLFGTK